MVDFREELRPASFRGISFEIADDDGAGGRRWVRHEYPGREEPGHEDMGGKGRAFSFRAIVIGDGFVANAKALADAFQQKGPGSLIHPHHGEMQVVVTDWRDSHSIDAIGMVSFNVSVERYYGTGGIAVLENTAQNLTIASDGMFDLASGDFLDSLAEGLFPDFVTKDGLTRMRTVIGTAQSLFSNYGLSSSFTGFNTDSLLAFIGLDGSLVEQVISLFKGTAETARTQSVPVIGSTTAAVALNSVESVDQVKLIKALATLSETNVDSPITPNSPSRAAIVQNAAAITTLTQASALAAAGSVARYASYESQEQAMEVRDLMADKLTTLRDRQLTVGLLIGARATTDMLVAVTEDINDQLGRLPRTVRIQTKALRSSLAIANRMYGSNQATIFDRADDIVARNRIAHPGFVGRKPLEVLVNA